MDYTEIVSSTIAGVSNETDTFVPDNPFIPLLGSLSPTKGTENATPARSFENEVMSHV